MSKCVSRHGEFSEHDFDGDKAESVCILCGVARYMTGEPSLDQKVDRILEILEPLAAFVENDLPEIKGKAMPLIDAIGNSPILKMIGVKVP